MSLRRPCVLVFAGLDPSGGAGIQADIEAISAMGAHALPIVTTLTVQDNDRVFAVHPVDAAILRQQVQALMAKLTIDAIKICIVSSEENVAVIADTIQTLRAQFPDLPVVLDPVLASGHGDALARVNAVQMLEPLRSLATLITPNLPEAAALCEGVSALELQLARQADQAAADALLAPPLARSAWMSDNGNVPVLARILLKGQTGPIEGISYGAGLMPPLEKTHTDEQLAQVLTYAGERWHGWSRPLTADDIAKIRQETGARSDPWTHEELKALGK